MLKYGGIKAESDANSALKVLTAKCVRSSDTINWNPEYLKRASRVRIEWCVLCPHPRLLSSELNMLLLERDYWFTLENEYVFRTLGPLYDSVCQTLVVTERDSVMSEFNAKNNLLKAIDIPSPVTVLVLRQHPRETGSSVS